MSAEFFPSHSVGATIPEENIQSAQHVKVQCALCELPTNHPITAIIDNQEQHFCCYGCRHIYELIAPDLAQGLSPAAAMGRAGLDLSAPCCRGVIHGDPAEEARNTLSRLMLNAFLGMAVMGASLTLYSELFYTWGESGAGVRSLLQLIAMLFATPAVLLLALPILEDAILTWNVYRRLTMNALVAIGSLSAYGISVYATFTGRGNIYYETTVMILLLVTVGRWLDAKTQVEGNKAIEELLAASPTEASLIGKDGVEQRVSVERLIVGDTIRVRPGESFAVDGQILAGEGSVNEASITGEATPAYKGLGSLVYAGTLNVDGSFAVEVTQVGEDRVMGKLVRLLDEARLHRSPIEQLADRVSAYFVPVVMGVALLTFTYWTWQVGWERAMFNTLSVVLIACPCALGVATPLAIWTGLARAAKQGILIRDSRSLEKLSHIRQVFFDKTGTLTTGQVTLAETVLAADLTLTADELLQLAASLEHYSEHPLARSIEAAATERSLPLLPATDFQARAGVGIVGRVAERPLFVGSWRLVAQVGTQLSPELVAARSRLESAGLSVVHIGWEGKVQGLFGLREVIRPAAVPALNAMRQRGLKVEVLTGDSASVGNALGQQLGVPVHSELLPADKLAHITQLESTTPVAMVGDGLNDAPALARATVGIALGCGADVTRESADVSLIGNDLAQISWIFALARRVYRTIAWNLAWAFVYNLLGVGLAMAGLLHPIWAALAMVLSSALVVGNSLRIRNFSN
ncbi:MAG: cation-translocating P-type ATPase [Caldilineaceae bacterium]